MRRGAVRALLAAYGALLAAPVGAATLEPTIVGFAGGCVAGAVAVALLTRRIDPVEWLVGWRSVGVAVAPGGWTVALMASLPPSGNPPWARLVGGLAVVPGVVAIGLAYHARTRQQIEEATTHATFTARPAPAVRRQITLAVLVLLLATVVIGVGIPLAVGESVSPTSFVWLPATLPIWIAILTDDDGREVAVTDSGLRVQQALHDWDGFTSYERTDDELAVYRGVWYRGKFSFDIEDIEDPDAVLRALDRYLPPR